jgi:predicted phosphodiesterase
MDNQDTLIVGVSDLHSGGSTALFPDTALWKFDLDRNHTPTEKQKRMYKHWGRCAAEAKRLREGKRMILVHNGDAIDGWRYMNVQTLTIRPEEQSKIHVFLMRKFMDRVGFNAAGGDRLVYIRGTEVHTGETEMEIAAELNAEYLQAHDFVDLKVNGRRFWFLHQGPNSAEGQNAGDGMRNWLKRIYWARVNAREYVPDVVVTGHYHKPVYSTYVQRRDDGFHTIHGITLPSWQMKTRFAYKAVPVAKNEIGAGFMEVTAAGDIRSPSFMLMGTENGVSVTV